MSADGRIIFKRMLKKQGKRRKFDLSGSGYASIVGSCEHGNEQSVVLWAVAPCCPAPHRKNHKSYNGYVCTFGIHNILTN
jgi:hypothetical protein